MTDFLELYKNAFESNFDLLFSKDFSDAIQILKNLKSNDGRLLIAGIGGSAANAHHAAADFNFSCELSSIAFGENTAFLTASTNDFGWRDSVVHWLKSSRISNGDALLILSVGGGSIARNVSANLVSGLAYAKKKNAKTISIVGANDGDVLEYSDVAIIANLPDPLYRTPVAECLQTFLLHALAFHPMLKVNKSTWERLHND